MPTATSEILKLFDYDASPQVAWSAVLNKLAGPGTHLNAAVRAYASNNAISEIARQGSPPLNATNSANRTPSAALEGHQDILTDLKLNVRLELWHDEASIEAGQALEKFLAVHQVAATALLNFESQRTHARLMLAKITSILDALNKPAMVLQSDGHVIATNALADKLVEDGDSATVDAHGHIRFIDRVANTTFLRMLVRGSTPNDGQETRGRILRFQCTEHLMHSARLQPIRITGLATDDAGAPNAQDPATGGNWLMTIQKFQSRPEISPADVCAMFGLTNAEGRVGAALASGQTIIDYAKANHLAAGTARWHLSNVLKKTDCSNQQELIVRILHGLL